MSEYLLPVTGLYNESEFNAGTGACGPTILAGQGRWRTQSRTPSAQQAMQQMITWGLCGPTGVTTLKKLYTAAQQYGYKPATRTLAMMQQGVSPLSFAARCLMHRAGYPAPGISCVLLTNGQALVDYLSRQGEDATNLENHFIGLCGYNTGGYSNFLGCNVPAGFFAIDGASGVQNPVVPVVGRMYRFINTQLCYYTTATVNAAKPADVYIVSR
jgi:hypothetical protein